MHLSLSLSLSLCIYIYIYIYMYIRPAEPPDGAQRPAGPEEAAYIIYHRFTVRCIDLYNIIHYVILSLIS